MRGIALKRGRRRERRQPVSDGGSDTAAAGGSVVLSERAARVEGSRALANILTKENMP